MSAFHHTILPRLRQGTPLFRTRRRLADGRVRYASQFGPSGPFPGLDQPEDEDDPKRESSRSRFGDTMYRMFETAATTFASLLVLGGAGYGYHLYYKSLVLRKMNKAFDPGDPVLDLAAPMRHFKPGIGADSESEDDKKGKSGSERWIERDEQQTIDDILNGVKKGRYYLIIGEKGTGKSSMIIEAMRKIDGTGISMFEAHADLEIFRIRLGKALNYEYHEDYIGSLFSVRGPRDTTALLDIERAFNKLEKIALVRREEKKNPIVIIVNCVHLIRNDDDGRNLLELMQQRAEQWAAANLVTLVFNSDDYWVYERFKRYATRMEVIPILDLTKDRAIAALQSYRARYFPDQTLDSRILEEVYNSVGGRVNFLTRVAKSHNMLMMCQKITASEKTWFLNRCGILGETMDDDVMDQQKYASAAMVMAKALVDKEKEMGTNYDPEIGHILPQVPLYLARQIMTRADFIESYDHDNIFTIDSNANVRADSVPMMNAFREICSEPGFEKYLEETLARISAIESIGRTKELTFKDLWFEQQDEQRGAYELLFSDPKGRPTGKLEFRVKPDPPKDDKDGDD